MIAAKLLNTARDMWDLKQYREAAIVAGLAIGQHLQVMCEDRGIRWKARPLEKLVNSLAGAGVLVLTDGDAVRGALASAESFHVNTNKGCRAKAERICLTAADLLAKHPGGSPRLQVISVPMPEALHEAQEARTPRADRAQQMVDLIEEKLADAAQERQEGNGSTYVSGRLAYRGTGRSLAHLE